MITIEKLIRVSKDVVAMNSFRSVYGWIELVRFALSQHEEIERLRAANKDIQAWFDDLKAEFDKVRRERDTANAIIAEQEQVVSSIGPITCRNGKIHERFSGCLYCDRDEAYEIAAQVADGYRCGGCGMDGKCGKAIRALKTGEPSKGEKC